MNQQNPIPNSTSSDPKAGLESLLAEVAFPGRTTLFVAEVAQALRVTKQHVVNLIDEGLLSAIDVAGGLPSAKRSPARRSLRIPVSSYDYYVRSRAYSY